MANYEYIISSLPAVSRDWKFGEGKTMEGYIGWIKSQLSDSDDKTVDRLLDGFNEECLNKEFYEAALKDSNRFIREYFTFDLGFRNIKASFLNKVFGRPLAQDTIDIETGEIEEAAKIEETLAGKDIVARERGLDSIRWDKIGKITTFSYFDMDAVLGIIAKIRLVERWESLDEESGREMFQNLIDETRGTFGGVNYIAPVND